jgi:hypothetical protein
MHPLKLVKMTFFKEQLDKSSSLCREVRQRKSSNDDVAKV